MFGFFVFFLYILLVISFYVLLHLLLLVLGIYLVWKHSGILRILGVICLLVVAYYKLSWISPEYVVWGTERVQEVSLNSKQFGENTTLMTMDAPPRLVLVPDQQKTFNSEALIVELNTRRTYWQSKAELNLDDISKVKRVDYNDYSFEQHANRGQVSLFYAFPAKVEPVSESSFVGFSLPKWYYILPIPSLVGGEYTTGWKMKKTYFGWKRLALRESESGPVLVELNQIFLNSSHTDAGDQSWILGGKFLILEPLEDNKHRLFILGPFNVNRDITHFSGSFSDRAIDSDDDGLFDQIGVSPAIKVLQGGTYTIFVTLKASNRESIQSYTTVDLSPGNVNPEVKLSTGEIKKTLKVNGSYIVSQVRLQSGDVSSSNDTVDIVSDLGKTATYDISQLQDEAIIFSGNFSAVGVDVNGNGKFDFFDVTLPLKIRRGGVYQWSASLREQNHNYLDSVAGSGFLSTGNNSVKLRFNGAAIGRNAVDGVYRVSGFIIYNARGASLQIDDDLTTQSFTASQFEGAVADKEPPKLSVSVTPNTLSPPNHQMVEIKVNTQVSDNVDPAPAMGLVSIATNDRQRVRGDYKTSTDIEIKPDGRVFLRAELSKTGQDRVYTLTYAVRDRAGNDTQATVQVRVPRVQGK